MKPHRMISKIRNWSLGSFAALATISVSPAAVIAPLDLSDWPDGWTVEETWQTTVAVTERTGIDYLRIGRTDVGTGAIVFWNGAEAGSDVFGNFSGSVILQFSGGANHTFGFVVGASNKTYTNSASTNNQGYYIGVQGNTGLGIWRNTLTATNPSSTNVIDSGLPGGGAWASMPGDAMLSTGTYQFEFAVSGPSINATLWSLNAQDQKTGSAIATLSYTMADDIEGYFGLFGGRWSNTNRNVYFRDVKLEVIPEPRLAMAGFAGVLICLYRFRKSK